MTAGRWIHRIDALVSFYVHEMRITSFSLGEVPSLLVSGNSQHLKQHGIQPIGRRLICVCLRHIALTRLFYSGSNMLHCVPWCASELRNLIKHNVDLLTMYIYIYISLHIRTARELLGEWLQEWVTIARHNLIVMNL